MEKIVIPFYRPTLLDNYEEGYHDGFNDGFDIAMLIENDQEWVAELCYDLIRMANHKHISRDDVRKYVEKEYMKLMEQKKSGISTIYNDITEEDLLDD